MQSRVHAAVPVLYVRNLDVSRSFYAAFGYRQQQSGGDGDGRWSYLQCGDHTLLLAYVQPPLIPTELPLLIYLYVTDLADVRARLEEAGHRYEPAGYPDHAPGGEISVTDPDGNTLLVGQRTAVPPEDRVGSDGPERRFSLIRQAAEAVGRRGGAPVACQVGMPGGGDCEQPAEVKLADTWGATVWGCLEHADEALINAPASFIATEDAQGLGPWLSRRRPS